MVDKGGGQEDIVQGIQKKKGQTEGRKDRGKKGRKEGRKEGLRPDKKLEGGSGVQQTGGGGPGHNLMGTGSHCDAIMLVINPVVSVRPGGQILTV